MGKACMQSGQGLHLGSSSSEVNLSGQSSAKQRDHLEMQTRQIAELHQQREPDNMPSSHKAESLKP